MLGLDCSSPKTWIIGIAKPAKVVDVRLAVRLKPLPHELERG